MLSFGDVVYLHSLPVYLMCVGVHELLLTVDEEQKDSVGSVLCGDRIFAIFEFDGATLQKFHWVRQIVLHDGILDD